MTDERLKELRRLVRGGQFPRDLHAELRSVVQRLVGRRLLPPVFAPYGQWNDEAADEIFAAWYTERLLGLGHLQSLLDQARTAAGFRKLAELSLRQHLYNASERSQARNLFGRLVEMLEQDDAFVLIRDAARPQDRWWRLESADDASEWAGGEQTLVSEAWALGEFVIVRYRADAKKLSPVLAADELKRFVVGLLERVAAALTPRLIMRALEARFDLGETVVEAFDDLEVAEPRVGVDIAEEVALHETALSIVAELTPRQLEVLRRSDGVETIDAMATDLGCSVGTIVNEQNRVRLAIERFSEQDSDRTQLLRILSDLVYRTDDADD